MYFGYKELRGPKVAADKNVENNLQITQKNVNKETKTGLHLPHATLGWITNKNATKSERLTNNFDVSYNTDELGFRRTPVREQAEVTIYFFGDSFTFGHGVEDFETFASVIASTWLDKRVKTVNAGVSGYGITQMYVRFLETLSLVKEGDLVVFTPISKDILRSYKDFAVPAHYLFNPSSAPTKYYPYFDQGEIKMGKLDTLSNRFKGLLFHAPLTGNAFRKIYRNLQGPIDFDDAASMFEIIEKKSAEHKARFYLYFLPQVKDLVRGRYKYDVSRYNYVDIWNFFPPGDVAKEKIGFPDDGHWNCRGHEIAAHAIVSTLIENGALNKKYLQRSLENIPQLCVSKNPN